MKHKIEHMKRLCDKLTSRYNELLDTLGRPQAGPGFDIMISSCEVRMAVDDFKTTLRAIRRLK